MPNHVSIDEFAVQLVMCHGVWPGTHNAHGAFQDVEKLRQLVQGARAQEPPERRNAVIRLGGLRNDRTVLADSHAPKLVDNDFLAVQAVTALAKQNGSL